MKKDYLPSKQFIIRVAILVGLVLLSVGINALVRHFTGKSKTPVQIVVQDVIQKDSNENGISDWEEYLWGLDPKRNGEENKAFIEQKKFQLNSQGDKSNKKENISENETLSREFFALIISLLQSGNLSDETMNSISETIGQKVTAEPIADKYSKDMMKIKNTSVFDEAYAKSLQNMVVKYETEDLGSELLIIAEGISNGDGQALYVVGTIANSYRNFGKDLMNIEVPEYLYGAHLNLANDFEKTAISVEGLSKLLTDPIIGMKSLINYKNYSDAIVKDLEYLSNNL